jgi:hypothetical protein
MYGDQRDIIHENKNVRHDFILKEYAQEFVDSIIKPSTSKCPSSGTTKQTRSLSHKLKAPLRNSG